jgi:hypothetical protein
LYGFAERDDRRLIVFARPEIEMTIWVRFDFSASLIKPLPIDVRSLATDREKEEEILLTQTAHGFAIFRLKNLKIEIV